MSRRIVRVVLGREEALRGAVADLRGQGHDVLDVLAPYAVHGLPELLERPPSRLPWVCLVAGVVGLVGGLAGQIWTSAVDWPVDVGGKPLSSIPAFVPVAFELAVLLGGLSTVAAFLLRERTGRLRLPARLLAGATDDRFVVLAAARGAGYDPEALAGRMRERFGALEVEEVLIDDELAEDDR